MAGPGAGAFHQIRSGDTVLLDRDTIELPDLFGVQHLAERVVVAFGERVGQFPRPAAIGSFVHADELTRLQVAVNRMLFDAQANLVLGRLGELPELLRPLIAEGLLHLENVLSLARADQAAAASGRPEANALGLQQDDVHAHFGEIQSGGQPRESAANHADVGRQLFFECGTIDEANCGRDVVTVGVTRSVGSSHPGNIEPVCRHVNRVTL